MKTLQLRKNNQITLPKDFIPEGATQFECDKQKDGTIILKPMVAIPANEAWIYNDPKLLNEIKQGIHEAKNNKQKHIGSFAQHLKDEI